MCLTCTGCCGGPCQVSLLGIVLSGSLFGAGLLMGFLLIVSPNQVVTMGFKVMYIGFTMLGLFITVSCTVHLEPVVHPAP
jgi:hypothetical protein